MFIKPNGKLVPDPQRSDFLPPEGRNVEPTTYWHRRLADGDVVEIQPGEAPASKKNEA